MQMEPEEPVVAAQPPAAVERGMERLFADMEELSDYIFQIKDVAGHLGNHSIKTVRSMAADGKDGPNEPPTIWLLRFVRALRDEVEELEESLAWKWWRPDKTDLQNVRVEIVDIFHFLVSAAQAAGMDGATFARVCYEKRKLNFDRQKVGFRPDDNRSVGVLGDGQGPSLPGSPNIQGGPVGT